ncbi:MAG: GntR family transcriptional regulator [Raoultibacter sp.]
MEIVISNASDKPIYEQISSQIKDLVLSGELNQGDQLPSIRALANDLHISVITTKRAYTDLEALGFLETVPGKGSFVAGGNLELMKEEKLRRVEDLLSQVFAEAKGAGLSTEDLIDLIHVLRESDDNE